MTNRRYRSAIISLAAAAFVLLFAAVSLSADEPPRKDDSPRKRDASKERKSGERKSEEHKAPSGNQQEHRQPQTERHTPQQPSGESHPANAAPQPHVDRPVQQQQPTTPNAAPREPVQSNRPGGYPNNSPNRNDRPRDVQNDRPRDVQNDRPRDVQTNQPGRQFGRDSNPAGAPGPRSAGPPPRVVTTRGGDIIRRDSGGRVREVHMSGGTVVYHPPSGVRRVEVVRPGGRVVVATSSGHGYVQRPVVVNNITVVKRTYVVNGVSYARVYRPVTYRGVSLHIYTPVRYYRPAFYVYAYNPWARPVIYDWGWRSRPWYGYYGGYFTPYPVYASPALWLTDYLFAATLEEAYRERMAASAPPPPDYSQGGNVALTPEVKQQIADEVRRQIDQERSEGQSMNADSGRGPMFDDNAPHVFVAFNSLDVNSNAGECTVSEGAVLQTTGAPPQGDGTMDVVVLASRGRDCPKGSRAMVPLQDLQEMQNHMRETLDRGMGDLQSRQGQNGLPAMPAGAGGTIDTPLAAQAQPDSNVGAELSQVTQETERAEQAVVREAGAAPPTLSLGMTIDQVKAIQGEPDKIVDLGAKRIYVYKDLKITFTDGKTTDIQ